MSLFSFWFLVLKYLKPSAESGWLTSGGPLKLYNNAFQSTWKQASQWQFAKIRRILTWFKTVLSILNNEAKEWAHICFMLGENHSQHWALEVENNFFFGKEHPTSNTFLIVPLQQTHHDLRHPQASVLSCSLKIKCCGEKVKAKPTMWNYCW